MSELRGSMTIRPMCSDSLSPVFVQLFPPSIDLYTPSPYATTRWALFSPLPTQTTLGFFGSMATVPMEKEPSPSKTGVKLMPALVVFQTPPAALATYQIFLSVGWTAMSATRPDVRAGPIERNVSPEAR